MITNPRHEYKSDYAPDNVYGHTIELLKRNLNRISADDSLVHLDIGCGYGAIAPFIRDELSRTYIGIDANPIGLEYLTSQGFETHQLYLSDSAEIALALDKLVGSRKVGSITMLDTLEHLPNGEDVIRGIQTLALKHNALFVLSVPNMLHRDIGFKLALGGLEYTTSGLLDYTHVRMYSERILNRLLRSTGFRSIDDNHVLLNHSDQYFPATHPALLEGTSLRDFLKVMRASVDRTDRVNQLVVAALPAEPTGEDFFTSERDEARPFLSVVIRTQGSRSHNLSELFVCLAGQTCRDFEVLIVGHKLTKDGQISVEQLIEDQPQWLQSRITFLRIDHGNRTAPLNYGFSQARGQYISIHDDDDIPMGHWVESFRELASKNNGQLLRCISLLQHADKVKIGGVIGVRATGSPNNIYPTKFDFMQHLGGNYSPNNTLAFPRGIFHDLGIKFDENLSTTEDWDYIMRVASVVGVASSNAVTGIYQWWESSNSRSLHSDQEWDTNKAWIQHKLSQHPILLPGGAVRTIIDGQAEVQSLRSRVHELENYNQSLIGHASQLSHNLRGLSSPDSSDRVAALGDVYAVLHSTSWRITAPLRLVFGIFKGQKSLRFSECIGADIATLRAHEDALKRSTSWRVGAPVRRLGRMLK
ncbi:methyltransferase domain-containing protein [Brucella anthropi]|uniref:methyltransferase domain-containing protein n=1 Tax=Brucella anthropi TaxID=529 RepID=UPI00124C9B25|nr:methyltransferase domain-containing protein [Brucella anthropi]KAB2724126.1 methyltransferase domain-containing protein [Brucella anthropi]KAB2739659.1 methyltransferase domain-containing protein [Brucella anthropi]KAB2802018.1 methyltransferase domain-containing protein [Brucella anthropi]